MIDSDFSVRSDPDALLSAIAKKKNKKRGGRLYLFLGMSPGVGKTYAMLLAAHEAKKSGSDVAIGVVETHGRKETELLVQGLEVVPKRKLEHRGITFHEMDIDAILVRKPMIALVDELAHTNVTGSRHAKRWQDVIELLDGGIDVYSTLNVQHLESRKDAVEEIAKITVSETVPDLVLDRAFQIQLIDLSVPDLLRRLKEGKVYLGDKAELAAAHFFREEKLTALREIALRVAAERVDAELQTFATEREAGTTWSAVDRMMVAVGHGPEAERLIRATRRMAYNLDAPWIAIHVSTNEMVSDVEKSALVKNLELARNLGAEIITITDTNLIEALIRIARQKDVTQIVVGRSSTSWFKDLLGRGSTLDQLLAKSNIDVWVIGPTPKKELKGLAFLSNIKVRSTFTSYAKAVLFTGVLSGINALLALVVGYRAVGFLYLLGILALGLLVPIGPVLLASAITVVMWNFFFIPPVGAFHVSQPDDIFMCLSYFVAALATGILSRRIKYQQDILSYRETRSQILGLIVLDIATETTPKAVIAAVINRVTTFLGGDCDVTLVKKDKSLSPFVEHRLTFTNISREMVVAKWAIDNNKAAGRFTETLSSAEAVYIPLKGSSGMVGALAYLAKKSQTLSTEDMNFLFTAARQLAVSLERENFRKRALETERLSDSEKLHQTLLQSLVAEVRISSASILQGGERLAFTMDNVLAASRLAVGVFPLKKEPCDLNDMFDAAILKVQYALRDHRIVRQAGPHLPKVKLERDLFIQALANVLLNAAIFSPAGGEILVEIRSSEREVKVTVSDQGPGVIEQDLGRIFEKFYRSQSSMGAGLGLAIAKGVIKAHAGKISASNRPSGGLVITINLPLEAKNEQANADSYVQSTWGK